MQGWTYPQLVQAMQDWPVKAADTYLANINRLIFLGEKRLIVDLDLDIFDVVDGSPVALNAGNTTVAKPAGSTGITFSPAPGAGAVSGTLNAAWSGVSGSQYVLTFQDAGASTFEFRQATLTNGSANVTWSGGLTSGVSAAAVVNSQFVLERNLWVIYSGSQIPLLKRSYDYVVAYANAAAGRPKYYCDQGLSSWLFAPQADANATGIIRKYVQRPLSCVVTATGTNWLTDNAGDILFSACLMESEHFLKNDDRYADYRTKYYQELLPNAAQELGLARRAGKYAPLNPIASLPAPPPPPAPQQ